MIDYDALMRAANDPALRSSDAAIRARRRVREALEAAGIDPERFVAEWCRAQHETEEAER